MLILGLRQHRIEIPSSRFSYYCIDQKVTKLEVIWALFFWYNSYNFYATGRIISAQLLQ